MHSHHSPYKTYRSSRDNNVRQTGQQDQLRREEILLATTYKMITVPVCKLGSRELLICMGTVAILERQNDSHFYCLQNLCAARHGVITITTVFQSPNSLQRLQAPETLRKRRTSCIAGIHSGHPSNVENFSVRLILLERKLSSRMEVLETELFFYFLKRCSCSASFCQWIQVFKVFYEAVRVQVFLASAKRMLVGLYQSGGRLRQMCE